MPKTLQIVRKGVIMSEYEKTGYLKEDFRYFHIAAKDPLEYSYHYHDFHKVLFFLSGDVTYHVEGRSFDLLPQDLVLIPAGEIHRPSAKSSETYERIILYLSPSYLSSLTDGSASLSLCLERARSQGSNVLRVPSAYRNRISAIFSQLEKEIHAQKADQGFFAGDLYQHILVQEFLILLNRASLSRQSIYLPNSCKNEKILQILDYIARHLSDPLCIDQIAGEFFMSRYHLMHLFKESTGYTVGNYITIKRLLYARSLIQKGTPVTQACYLCGFQNYSTFSRAYKKHFHTTARSD